MKKRVAYRPPLMFWNPFETGWTSKSDYEKAYTKFLGELGLEARRVDVMGGQESEIWIIEKKQTLSTEPKMHKAVPINIQTENLTKSLRKGT